ncbi:MAG TPA: sigma-54 dependent transcriptional regulator [Candidatus Megaira endosymbiont of Nemacystus decipiens]|nr:sigma-54 dependent transcriptional regulator [Candidatus Megaera endosymbiont of Nemacystus decipiens]
MTRDVLIIDDEADIRDLISDSLKDEQYECRVAANSQQAFERISEKVPSAVILDIWLQDSNLDGLGILEIIKKRHPLMPVIVISGHGTIETAVNAIKMGAYDYIEKPFTHSKLLIVLRRACESAKLKRENIELKSRVIDKTEFIGKSAFAGKLKATIERIAPTSGRVMIHGGPGAGKELTARLIHKKSKRANAPFVIFKPFAVEPNRILYELFGENEVVDKNAILDKKTNLVEAAHNGTLYIDEVGAMPISAQVRLLKFLKDNTISKNNKQVTVNVRIITSNTKDLQQEILNGNFKQDLYYRLNVVPLNVPTLSERKEDIAELTRYFVSQLSKISGLKEREFSNETIAALQAYSWPGNIRQLRNVVENTLIMNPISSSGSADKIRPDMLPQEIVSSGVKIVRPDNANVDMMSMPLREAREVFERQYLTAQMNRFNNNISKTSTFVGMERSALHRKLKTLNIHATNKTSNLDSEEGVTKNEANIPIEA